MQHEYQIETSDRSVTRDATLGARLRRLRIERRISLIGFARQVGVSRPTVWNWERGKVRPRQKSLKVAASVLGISEMELVFGAGDGPVTPVHEWAQPQNLSEVVSACKAQIAEAAGARAENVLITIRV